jgi:enoyl-[acyl-carrier-protein] reductase (NADH)
VSAVFCCALLQVLLDAKVQNVKDAITAVSTEATQESALEELLAKVTTKWATIDFNIIPYKDSKDILIMGPLDDIQVGRVVLAMRISSTSLTQAMAEQHAHLMTYQGCQVMYQRTA